MEVRVATYSEYSISSGVTGIKNIVSQTLEGIVVEKVYFQPEVNVELTISRRSFPLRTQSARRCRNLLAKVKFSYRTVQRLVIPRIRPTSGFQSGP